MSRFAEPFLNDGHHLPPGPLLPLPCRGVQDDPPGLVALRTELEKLELTEDERSFLSDRCLCRYLRARQFNVEKAHKMIVGTLQWRAQYKPHLLTPYEIESQLRMGHMYHNGWDKEGRPVLYLRVHTSHDPHTREEKLKFMVQGMQSAIDRMDKEAGVEKMVWVVDCRGYNLKHNGDIRFASEFIHILQNHFPERLGKLFVCDAPTMFYYMWKVVSVFVDPVTKEKVTFVRGSTEKNGEKHKQLTKVIDDELLEEEFSGSNKWRYNHASYMAWLESWTRRGKEN